MHASGQVCYLPVTAGALETAWVGGGGYRSTPEAGASGFAGVPDFQVRRPADSELEPWALLRGWPRLPCATGRRAPVPFPLAGLRHAAPAGLPEGCRAVGGRRGPGCAAPGAPGH